MATQIEYECLHCGRKFYRDRGRSRHAKFCSRSCTARATVAGRNRNRITVKCKACSKQFEVPKCRVATVVACSRKCLGYTQRNPIDIEVVKVQLEAGASQKQIAREFGYSDASLTRAMQRAGLSKVRNGTNYRRLKLNSVEIRECELCGWCKFEELLVVHHADGNRKNSNLENLILVCPVCHCLCHLTTSGVNYSSEPKPIETVRSLLASSER